MFLARPGEYEACGIFTIGHLILIAITLIGVIIALKLTANKKDVKRIIRNCTIFVWICEIAIIAFKIAMHGTRDLNQYVPLYYCSLLLYAGGFSSFGKGKLKRVGDVFLATGGIAGGLIFILFPSTSLPTYPMLHFVSIHSFIFHGIMLYLGILVNLTNYIELEKKDIIYYSSLIGIICIMAYVVNEIFGSNLMFISRNFPGTFIEIIYNLTGRFFTIVMILAQMFLPFYTIYGMIKLIKRKKAIVIFGGAFNPPHKFHFSIAEQVLKQYPNIEKVVFAPVNVKYRKEGLIENQHRYNMLKKVTEKNSKLEVSNIDLQEDRSLPTIEVLEKMQEQFKDKEIWTLMGTDNLRGIHTWDRAKDLVSKYKFIIMERNEDKIEDILEQNDLLKNNKSNFKKLEQKMSNSSSTAVREKIKNNENFKDLVPEEVYKYIQEKELYRR